MSTASIAIEPEEPAPADTPEPDARPRSLDARLWRIGLPLVLLLAALPRVLDARRTPFLFDEIYAILLARGGRPYLLETLSRDVDQPLHFLVVWAWRALGGESEAWLRIPSLGFALATVAITGLLARAMFGPRAGLLAAALIAVHPTHVLYSHEARFHAMVWCLTATLAWLAWRWIQRPSPGAAAAIVALAAAMLYTDVFSWFVLAALLCGGLAALRDARRRWAWVGLFALAALLYSPQLPTLVAQIARDIEGERLLPPMPVADVVELFRKLAFNAAYLVPAVLALAAIAAWRRDTRRPATLLLIMAAIPIVVPFALSQAGVHLFINRQMLFVIPLACALAAGGLVALRPQWLSVVAALVAVTLGTRACLLRQPLQETVDLPRAVAWIRQHGGERPLVVSCETRALLTVWFYLPRAEARLLVMPDVEPFHYSDGVLVVPRAMNLGPAEFAARAAREPWTGIRLQHAGRDGPVAAGLLDRSANERERFGGVTVWRGAQPPR
jgi:uncharacterized membrane protein